MTDHIYWKNGALYLLDQRALPFKKTYVSCRYLKDVVEAINNMTVRGAPLLGIVAAYGVVIGIQEIIQSRKSVKDIDVAKIMKKLGDTRPTAVNLFWALQKMGVAYEKYKNDRDFLEDMLEEAISIHVDDIENNRMVSLYGAELIDDGDTILTHMALPLVLSGLPMNQERK
jgi:methylthioribose-1-phosphate isomerase